MDELEHMEKDLDAALPAPPVSQQPKTEKNETGIIPPKKNIQAMMEELADMEKDLSVALPTLSFMSPETKKQIMDNIAHQEANWESLHPADIKIDKEEVSMWGGFMGGAKKSDFIGQKVLETLESGEIVDLTINGFESFRIVKIRAKNKDTHAMSVIEFIKKDPKNGRLIK